MEEWATDTERRKDTNEFVKHAREESMFWHWMWLECKKPNAGAVYECKRHTRRAYHSAIRRTICKLKNIFEKRKLLNIAMKSLRSTSGSVSSGLILVGSIYRVRSIMKLILGE